MLRHKNRLMRWGSLEESSTLAHCIGRDIERHNRSRVSQLQGKVDVKEVWAAVQQLTGASGTRLSLTEWKQCQSERALRQHLHWRPIHSSQFTNSLPHTLLHLSQSLNGGFSKSLILCIPLLLALTSCLPGFSDWVHHSSTNL